MRPLLKICGLMRPEDVRMCCDRGVDICGFVVDYPLAVPWNLAKEQCRELMSYVIRPSKSCIVTGGDKKKIIALARSLRPDYIQLHYLETLEDTYDIIQELSGYGIGVIKTMPNSPEERVRQFGRKSPEECARKLCEAGVSIILIDAREVSNAAVGGEFADLFLYSCVKRAVTCPVMLGGGINTDNCEETVGKVQPDILDIMRGAEIVPGMKSDAFVSKLIELCSKFKQ